MSIADGLKRYSIELTVFGAALFLVLWSLLLWNLAVNYEYRAQSTQHQAAVHGPISDDEPKNSCATISGFYDAIDCLVQKIAASRETQRREQDLTAQQDMAEWAFWIVLLTGAQAVLSLLGVILLVRNLGLAREANQVAREVGRDQTRAYVYAEKAEYSPNSGPPFVVWVKNGGQTPAKDVETTLFIGATNKNDGAVTRPDDIKALRWGHIGPGDSIPVPLYQGNIVSIIEGYVASDPKDRSLLIGGTIQYVTIYGEELSTDLIFSTSSAFNVVQPLKFDISVQGDTDAFAPRRKGQKTDTT